MTAPSAEAGELLYRVACPCAWMGNRRKPTARLPVVRWARQADQDVVAGWPSAPERRLHPPLPLAQGVVRDPDDLDWLVWPDGRRIRFQADHYSGSTCDLPRRLAEHLSGRGAKLVAAALELGADVRVSGSGTSRSRSSNGSGDPSRPSPHRRPMASGSAPFSSGRCALSRAAPATRLGAAWPRRRSAATTGNCAKRSATRQARRDWDAHCAELKAAGIWDADKAWDEAFPQLAYDTPADQATHPSTGNADQGVATATLQVQPTHLAGPSRPPVLQPAVDQEPRDLQPR